jgi:hypothetical protein
VKFLFCLYLSGIAVLRFLNMIIAVHHQKLDTKMGSWFAAPYHSVLRFWSLLSFVAAGGPMSGYEKMEMGVSK